jgi:hypothetical protein
LGPAEAGDEALNVAASNAAPKMLITVPAVFMLRFLPDANGSLT